MLRASVKGFGFTLRKNRNSVCKRLPSLDQDGRFSYGNEKFICTQSAFNNSCPGSMFKLSETGDLVKLNLQVRFLNQKSDFVWICQIWVTVKCRIFDKLNIEWYWKSKLIYQNTAQFGPWFRANIIIFDQNYNFWFFFWIST